MMEKDWIFRTEEYSCGLRAAGVWIKDDMLLVQRDAGGAEYALPGGHVHIGETTEHALVREFGEELSVQVCIRRLLWTEECFWQWNGRMNHDLCFYYLIDGDADILPAPGCFVPHRDNPRVEVGWLPVSELEGAVIYPAFIRERIRQLDAEPAHFITYV